MNKFKIKEELTINGIIEIFEIESPIVKCIKEMILIMKRIVIISIMYFLGMCYIQKYKILPLIYAIIFTSLCTLYVYKVCANVSYNNSKKLGGKKVKYLKNENKKFPKSNKDNIKIMKREEMRVLKKVLKTNKIDNMKSTEEIRNYLLQNKKEKQIDLGKFAKELLSIYIIPITFGIIGIYTSISLNAQVEQELVNIGYIIVLSIIVIAISLIMYVVYKVKNFSITYNYTHQRLILLLTELLIQKYSISENNKHNLL